MSTLGIVLLVLVALLALLFAGGVVAAGRRASALDGELRRRIEEANGRLADAHALDKGWNREAIESAARAAFARSNPEAQVEALHLVQVVDRPGTEADQAVLHVVADGAAHTVTLGREGEQWVAI